MNIFKSLLVSSIILFAFGCESKKTKEVQSGVSVISFEQLKEKIVAPTGKIKVINFWATWCKPCIQEMPYFENVADTYKEQVELHFISLDFIEDLKSVEAIIDKKKISANTLLLNETKYDDFMPKINKTWTGAIPATLFVDESGNEYFYEKSFTEKELSEVINRLL